MQKSQKNKLFKMDNVCRLVVLFEYCNPKKSIFINIPKQFKCFNRMAAPTTSKNATGAFWRRRGRGSGHENFVWLLPTPAIIAVLRMHLYFLLLTSIKNIGNRYHEQPENPLYLQIHFLCSTLDRTRLHLNIGNFLAYESQSEAEGAQAGAYQGDHMREVCYQAPE